MIRLKTITEDHCMTTELCRYTSRTKILANNYMQLHSNLDLRMSCFLSPFLLPLNLHNLLLPYLTTSDTYLSFLTSSLTKLMAGTLTYQGKRGRLYGLWSEEAVINSFIINLILNHTDNNNKN